MPPRIYLLYHFFHPDDVISARLFSDLAVGLKQAGYDVTAFPSIRSCHASSQRYPKQESWDGGQIVRVWRPDWRQSSSLGRLLNTLFMLIGWSWRAATFRRLSARNTQEAVIIGTDPIFGLLASIPWRIFRPHIRIIHWCHDVHPEASIADGTFSQRSPLIRLLKLLMRTAYRRCDAVIDLGSCMRRILSEAGGWSPQTSDPRLSKAPQLGTITPWSLVEPPSPVTLTPSPLQPPTSSLQPAVSSLQPTSSSLLLLYSGNLGRAHEVTPLLELARLCRGDSIQFCFAGRGPGMESLKAVVTPEDTNVSFAGFAEEAELQQRLARADIHLVSLKPSWTGTVVPSKFFGALAIGRPVLFVGSQQCSLAQAIAQHQVGWNLTEHHQDHYQQLRDQLLQYASDSARQSQMQQHCWSVYQQHYRRQVQIERFIGILKNLTSGTDYPERTVE